MRDWLRENGGGWLMLAALLCVPVSVVLTLAWLVERWGGTALVATFATAGVPLLVGPVLMGVLDGQWTAAAFEAVPLAAVGVLLRSIADAKKTAPRAPARPS